MIRAAGLPAPEANLLIGRYRPDLVWREHRLIVGYQSREFHRSPHKQAADMRQANDPRRWGYTVLQVTIEDLKVASRVLVWIAAALTRSGWSGESR